LPFNSHAASAGSGRPRIIGRCHPGYAMQLGNKIDRWLRKSRNVLLILPALVFLVIFFMIPLFFLFVTSLQHYVPGKGMTNQITLENYVKFVSDFYYIGILFKTMLLALLVSFLTLIIGYPLAYFISRTSSKKKGFFIALVIFPLFLNLVVRSFSWIVLLANRGVVNNLLVDAGLIDQPVKLLYNYTGVIIGMTHIYLPFMVITLLSVIRHIDQDYEDAAQTLGADKLTTFLKITLPLSMPGVIAGCLLVFLLSLTAFVIPRLLGGVTVRIMSNLIYQEFMNTFNWPFGAAMGFILLAVTLMIIWVYLSVFRMEART
jgi:putative spermidine/putrescine transport system permease protein